jgi:hypothetical protein
VRGCGKRLVSSPLDLLAPECTRAEYPYIEGTGTGILIVDDEPLGSGLGTEGRIRHRRWKGNSIMAMKFLRIFAPVLLVSAVGWGLPLDIVPNGSFEADTNRDGAPDGWGPALFNSPGEAVWDRDVARSGEASVRLADSAHPERRDWQANSARWVLRNRAQIAAGKTVTAEGWVRSELTAGDAKIVLAWFAKDKWLHEDSSDGVTGKKEWTHRTISAEAPPQAVSVAVYLVLGNATGRVWFDDVRAVRGTAAPGNFRTLDIRAACNVGFRDETAGDAKGGWTDQGKNDLREIQTGMQTLRGVPFDVVSSRDNSGRGCIVLKGKGRQDVANSATFPVELTCDALYFLHACAWAGRKGNRVAEYIVRYDGGQTVRVPVRNGLEITDWWAPSDCDGCALGWQGHNAESNGIGLVILPWRNPHPETAVASVTAQTTGRGSNLMLVAVTAGDGEPSFPELPLNYHFTDTTGWYPWNFPIDNPDLGELDLSRFLDAPAGKHGFADVDPKGRIVFGNGTRGRFFGTNVGGSRCCPPKKEAEVWAARLASYGVNLLRLHAYDSKWADLIDYSKGNSRSLNPDALDRMDYFVAELKKRGIYVYFDLLDYRSMLPGDEVRDADKMGTRWEHSVKGASIFNRRIIDLQKEFATQLLTHRNPYTGLRYVDEPALLIQEITNENSVFYLANTKLMLPSYVAELEGLWNAWLVELHGDREHVVNAWTAPDGTCALTADEDPVAGTVALPARSLYEDLSKGSKDPMKAPVRLNAMTRFLYELEVAYYTEMTQHLRGLGLKCLITGTNQDFSDASNRANALCQAMTRNNYWCHPNLHVKPFIRFRNLSMLSSNIPRSATPIANIASSTVAGKPMISPEFNFPWPNEFRAESLPVTMAYASLQDWDGMLFFTYETRTQFGRLTYFGNTKDPVRWGQVPMAALMFHRGDVAPAHNTVDIGVSTVDTFSTRPRRTSDDYSPYCVVPYISKLRNAYFDDVYTGDADIAMSSGHSAIGDYSKAKRAIVFADSAAVDEGGAVVDRGRSSRRTLPGVGRWETVDGLTRFVPTDLPAGAEVLRRDGMSVGVVTERFYLLPSASQLGAKTGGKWVHRLLLDAFKRWNLPGKGALEEAGAVYRSDTGELVLDSRSQRFMAVTPRLRSVVGFLDDQVVSLGDVAVTCRTRFAAVSVIVLDDAADIKRSRRLLITAVARAENTGQATIDTGQAAIGIDADTGAFLPQSTIALAEAGRAPVLAEPVDADVLVPWGRARAFALNETGERARELTVAAAEGKVSVQTVAALSPWILLERQ